MGLLDLYAQTAGTTDAPLQAVPSTLGERVAATADETFAPDRYFTINRSRRDLWQRAADDLQRVTGEALPNPYDPPTHEEMMRLFNETAVQDERRNRLIEASRMARAQGNDELFEPENIDRYIGEEATRRRGRARDLEGTGNGFLNFLAAAGLETATPHGLAGLFVPVTRLPGAAATARSFLGNVLREGAVQAGANVALQAGAEGLDFLTRSQTGTAQTGEEIATNIAGAVVIGGGLGAGLRALHLKWLGLPEKVRAEAPLEVKDAFRAIEGETLYSGKNRLGVDPLLHERFVEQAIGPVLRGRPVDLAGLSRSIDTPMTALGTILRMEPGTVRAEGLSVALDRIRALPDGEIEAVLRETRPSAFATVDDIARRSAALDAKAAAIHDEISQLGFADVVDVDTGARLQEIEAQLSSQNLRRQARADLEREREMILQTVDRDGQVSRELQAVRSDFFPEQQAALRAIEEERASLARESEAARSVVQREMDRFRARLASLKVGDRFADDVPADLLAAERRTSTPREFSEALARADMHRQARIAREILPEGSAPRRTESIEPVVSEPETRAALDAEVARILGKSGEPLKLKGDMLAPKGTLFAEVRKLAHQAYQKLIGTEVVNEATGMSIKFDSTGRRKTMTGNEDMIRLVPTLPEMLRIAEPVRTGFDRAGDRQVKAWHRFRTTVEIDGKMVAATMDVREKHDGSFHYSLLGKRDAGGGGFSSSEGADVKPGNLTAESPSRAGVNIAPEDGAGKAELADVRAQLDAADRAVKDAEVASGCAMGNPG